ncbi:MAG: tetratricopeptide repeat protein [Bacteroidia bacterium]|nr:tetratricopeptide repeat protein [Bacteroidia bacterium]
MARPQKLNKREKFKISQEAAKVVPKTVNNNKNNNIIVYYAFIIASVFILYGNSLNNGYVLDDFSVIKENNIVNLGSKSIGNIFKTSYRAGYLNVNDGLYRPLSLAMFALEWQHWPDKPFVGHFINLICYLLCGIVLFNFTRKLFPHIHNVVLLLAVLLFIAHPIHTEVVGNIKSRDELLCYLFSILSMLWAIQYFDSKKILYLVLSSFSLFLAFLAKESAILTIPLLLISLWFFRKDRFNKYVPILLATLIPFVVYMLIRRNVLGSFAGLQTVTILDNPVGAQTDFILRIMGSFQVLGEYIQLFVFPHPLVYDYSYNSIPLHQGITLPIIIGIIIICSLIAAMFFTYKKWPLISYSILFIFISLSLYSNIVFPIGAAKAERFTFLASTGFCIALIYLFTVILKIDISKYSPNDTKYKNLFYLTTVILVLYSVKTISRNFDWKNNYTLYSHDVELNPQSAKTHYYLGNEIIKELANNETDKAKKEALIMQGISEVRKAIQIYPEYSDGYAQIGVGYYNLNNNDSAGHYFKLSLKYNESNSVAISNMGSYYFNRGEYQKAIEYFNRSIALNPRFADAMMNLGSCYGSMGKYQEALVWFHKAFDIDPTNQKNITFLALTYQNLNDINKANYYRSLLK